MGSQCMPEQRRFQKIDEFKQPEGWEDFHRADPKHSRFGNIQKIRTKRSEVYKLIMATNDARMQAVSIQCRILQSTAQFQLYEGTSFELLDHVISPIIDLFDTNDMQVYHPIKANNVSNLSIKLYPFSGYTDSILKRGVYQIHLYNQMRSMSPLVDFFIMTKEKISTLVMIFKRYQVSLHEIICYRSEAKFPWSQQELLYLWKMLVSNYKVMHMLGISHRDIRPSKIFYTSQSKNTPFQMANLVTARKLTNAQAENDLLTVLGVDQFAQESLKQKIRNGDNLASYNAFKADRKALQNLLLSTLNLDPLWKKDKNCENRTLSPIIQMLKDDNINYESIERKIQSIIKTKNYDKQELFSIDKIISDHLTKFELRRMNKERIEDNHLLALMRLHKREALVKWVNQKFQQNQAYEMKYDNILLMHKLAEYFESVGIQKNDYFIEKFILLLQLAKQCRIQEYYKDHQQHLNHLSTLLPKIPKQNNDLFISYNNQLTLLYLNQNKKDQANQQLNKLLQQSQRYNDSNVSLQLEVLITKVIIEITNKKYDTAENTIQKIGLVISARNFQTYYDTKFFQAQYQYLKAYFSLELMMANRNQITSKRISNAERSISNSIVLLTNLPISNENIAKIINADLIHSDLLSIKEAYAQSRKCLQSAETLMSQLQKTRSLSDNLKMKFLKRLKSVLEKSNKANEPIYKNTIDKIGKIQAKFENSNADRHRISKELRDKQKNKAKRQKILKRQEAIIQENEDEDI